VLLICGYEVAAVYLKTGIRDANTPSKNSGYFFGISAIAVGIDLLPLIKMVFSGPGLNVDEWVTQAYLYARRLSKVRVMVLAKPSTCTGISVWCTHELCFFGPIADLSACLQETMSGFERGC
jgi:hypothetical protein